MEFVQIDVLWVLISAALVFFMQAGFCCLESGSVRPKNSINVAAKNFGGFCVAAVVFWLVGYGLMFGESRNEVIGSSDFLFSEHHDPALLAFFVFQLMFCGTATTIVSGAIAERAKYGGYLAITALVAFVIYPLFGHWTWSAGADGPTGWLGKMGFVDFAGGTVVHSIAGWVSLAAVLIIGPRRGRYENPDEAFRSYSLPLAALGVIVIWIGWIGFNGGSTLAFNEQVPLIVFNTIISGAFGGVAAMVLGPLAQRRVDVPSMLNGSLAGLVAITPAAHAVTPSIALVIGIVGGGLCFTASQMLDRLKLDDVVYAFPVHAVAGMWGTLCVGLFGDLATLGTGLSRGEQISVQAAGVLTAAVWGFGASYILLRAVDRISSLRVSPEAEETGLNISEHAQSTEQVDLLMSMEYHRRTGDFSKPIRVNPNSELGDVAAQYNRVIEHLYDAKEEAEKASRAKSDFLASMSHELRTPLNAILGFSEVMTRQFFGPLGSDRYQEYAEDIHSSSTHLLSLVDDLLDLSKIEAGENDLDLSPIDLRATFDECLKIATSAKDSMHLYFDVSVPDDAPELLADDRATRQIILNLLYNAIKFTPKGGLITMSAVIAPTEFTLQVSDTGPGIPPDKVKTVMEPFTQLTDNPHLAQPGTGLGLSIAKSLIEAQGGRMEIKSGIGKGTTVSAVFRRLSETQGKVAAREA